MWKEINAAHKNRIEDALMLSSSQFGRDSEPSELKRPKRCADVPFHSVNGGDGCAVEECAPCAHFGLFSVSKMGPYRVTPPSLPRLLEMCLPRSLLRWHFPSSVVQISTVGVASVLLPQGPSCSPSHGQLLLFLQESACVTSQRRFPCPLGVK